MGRLELRRGQLEAARERLSTALELQQQLGDVTGLARTTAALADLYAMANRFEEAAALLDNSVALNFEKGSPIGLAFNRQALAALYDTTARGSGPQAEKLQGVLRQVENRLVQAESTLGRLLLPGESDARR